MPHGDKVEIPLNRLAVLSFLACVLTQVAAFAGSSGRHLSGDYIVTVDGRPVDVVRVPMPENRISNLMERQPYSYACFTATGTVEVCVRSGLFEMTEAQILPSSKGVSAKRRTADTIVFDMMSPMTLVLEPRGRHCALVISANRSDEQTSYVGDPKVRYFGPGFHRRDVIAIGDGETLYLAHGAWVESCLVAKGRDMTICGPGVLSGSCWDWREGPRDAGGRRLAESLTSISGENITVRDVTLFSSWHWTLVLSSVTNAVIDNVKILGGRVINDDGIDVCRAKNVTLRNSFVRSQDDCVTPKWWCEDLVCTNMTLWADAANVFRTGYECESGASGFVYRNLRFMDIDVLHLSLNKTPASAYWASCAIYIQPSHGQTMSDIVYDNIRFHECGPKDVFLNVKTMPITQDLFFEEPGRLNGLTLRNIRLPDSHGGMCVNMSAHDDNHPIENVRFENVSGYGRVTKFGNVDFQIVPIDPACGRGR